MSEGIESHFSSILKHGVARSNRFNVVIELPAALTESKSSKAESSDSFFKKAIKIASRVLSAYGKDSVRSLSLTCEQTEIPGRNLVSSDAQYNGDQVKSVYGTVYGMQPFTFHVSRDMYEKVIIDRWQELAFDPITHTSGYLDDYTSTITIEVLDNTDAVMYTVKLKNAFPMNCNPITLANSERDNMIPLMVTFMYKRWERPDQAKDGGLLDSLTQTPFGPYVTEILSNPVVKEATDWLKENGIDLEGEAMNIYNMVDDIVKNTTGQSINKSISLLNGMIASVEVNGKIGAEQKAGVIRAIRESMKILNKG